MTPNTELAVEDPLIVLFDGTAESGLRLIGRTRDPVIVAQVQRLLADRKAEAGRERRPALTRAPEPTDSVA